jgi:hypothetical protein
MTRTSGGAEGQGKGSEQEQRVRQAEKPPFQLIDRHAAPSVGVMSGSVSKNRKNW